ncbi:MAG: LacI family DNA-binding transcriptional regulator, partial [Oscillospiraceae bacterium]|nr:LacI family DNA-binding transcriptional regulator [Oscillospiraceae bacterium]
MKKVTIQDIADALGISRNTVSKAINNAEGLADATREKILKKAVEMEYKQFSYVAALTEGTTTSAGRTEVPKGSGEISLFTTSIFHMTNHFAALMLDRFRQELTQIGYSLNIHIVDQENIVRRTLPATFSQERCSGILCIEMFDWDYDEMLCQLGLPTLFVDTPNKIAGNSLPSDQLYMENTVGITKLVNEMLRKGKTRIGFLGDYG